MNLYKKFLEFFPSFDIDAKREDWIKDKLWAISPGQSILDAGTGDKKHKKYCRHLKYFSLDIKGRHDYVTSLEYIKDRYSHELWRCFDNVLCTEVLEHIPDAESAWFEMSRMLKPGGKLIITLTQFSVPHQMPQYYHTGFHANWIREMCKRSRMKIKLYETQGNYFDILALESLRAISIIKKEGHGAWMFEAPLHLFMAFWHKWSAMAYRKSNDVMLQEYYIVAVKQ